MPGTCQVCPVCGTTEVHAVVRKSITVCRCLKCKTVWHVVREADEPSAA